VQPVEEQALAQDARIMIVDDNPANLKLLEDMLRQQGYEVQAFPRGRLALAAANEEPPELILLDINMPEMNGYQVCEQLKANPRLSGIPVIFLSVLTATEDKVKGFRSGGVDYISKPFQFEEVHARVDAHLKLHELRKTLKLHNERLEVVVAERTRDLAQANERLTILDRSKNEFLNLISHELRTPLNGLLGIGELILEGMPLTEENHELQEMFEHSRQRILSIVDDALLLTQIDVNGQQFRCAPVSLDRVAARAIDGASEFAASRRVALAGPSATSNLVLADEQLLVRALQALITTAVRFSEEGETVRVTHEADPDSTTIIIESHGRTLPSPARPKFFDLFSIEEAATPGGDLGLGPAVAYRILSLFGALVGVVNRDPSGIRLSVSLKNANLGGDARGRRNHG
jgi:DNA-binding response OmpR family regulator